MPTYDVDVEGVTYEVNAPDPNTAWQWANYTHRQKKAAAPAAPKESTILGEVARGAKQLVSTSRTGIGALVSPEEAARAGVERGQQIAAEAGEGPSLAALRKVYEERGLLPAAGELVSQIPRALAGQVPQLAAMAGGAKLGAMAGAPLGPAGVIGGGILGAGATLLPQFFGANIERQAAEQMERGEPVKIDRGTAAAAAAGQAAIESAGTAFVLGKRVVKGVLGIADDAGLATAKARADLVKAAERSRLGAAGRGAAVGLAEIPVEVAQAVIERAQAGLDVLSPEAFTEYGENAYLAGLVGPTIGAATRVTEPGAARQKLAAEEQVKAGEARKAAREAEEAKKKDPQYLLDLDTNYQAAVERMKALQAAVPKRPAKDALPEEQMAYKAAVDARNEHLKEVLQPLAAEYVPRKAEIAQIKERQRVEGMSPEDYMLEQMGITVPKPAGPATLEEAALQREKTAPAVAPELTYAQQQLEFAQRQGVAQALDTDEQRNLNVEFLMQDPAIAQRLVSTQAQIPGLKPKENASTLALLKTQVTKYLQQQAAAIAAERPDLALPRKDVDTFAPWKQALEAEERMREEEAMAVEPVRKEEAVISPEREEQIKALDTARKRYLAAAETYQKARGTPDGARALQQLLAARKEYDSFSTTPMGGQAPRPVLSPETEAQLDKALTEVAGAAPASQEELESRIQRLADTRKTAIAKVSENASELAQYEKLTRYMGTPQGLSEIARTPEMAEAAKRRMTPMLEQAQASRNEAIAAAIQEIRLQRDASGLAPLDKSDADLQNEFRDKLNKDLQQAKGKAKVDDKKRQEAIAQQLRRINARIQQLESGDRGGRLLGYASAFRTQPERVGELNNLYKAYRNLSTQQGLTPQAAQLNRTLQNLVDFYTVGSGAAKPRVVAKGPREARRELVLGERAFTGYEPTIEGTEVRYQKPRKMAEYQATPEEQALVEDMRARELAELNEAADRQYTPETSDRVKKQIFDALRARIEGFNAPATQEEVDAARAQAAPQDQATGDLFAAATERAQAEFQAAGERRAAARSELGRAMAGMRGKSAIMDQAQRLAEKFGKDLGLEGTFAAAKQRLTQAQAAKRAAETEFTEKEQEALRAAADDALIAQRDAEAANRAANNTVDAIRARLEAEKETPAVEVRTPPRAVVLLRKIVELQSLIGEQRTSVVSGDKVGATFAPVTDVGSVKSALDQALRAAREGETWASDIEQVQAHMAAIKAQLQRGFLTGKLQELQAQYSKLAAHEAALRRPMYGAGQLTPAEIRDYTQRRLEMAQAEYDRIKLQIDGLHRQLLDTEVAVAKREVDRITGEINALVSRMERREGADLANQELTALTAQHKDAVANLDEAQKTFEERKKAESVPFTRKSPASALEQWMKGAQDRFEQSVQRFKDKQKALERQATAPAATPATTAAERRAEVLREAAAKSGAPRLQEQLDAALRTQKKMKNRGSKQQRAALAEKIASLREQIRRLSGESTFGTEYYEEAAKEQAAQEAREEAEAREAGKEDTTRAGRRKAAKEIFGVQRTIAETGKVPQVEKDGEKLENVIKNNRQAFEMAVEQGFKSTAIRPQKRGKSATPERLMRTPLEAIAYRLRQEIVEKLAAPQTKQQKKELNKLREHLRGLEEAVNTAPVTVEERRRTARAIWAKLPKDMRDSLVNTFKGRTESGSISIGFFDRLADALETTVIRQRLGEPLSQAPVTSMTKEALAPIQAETEKRVAATMKATEELRNKYYEQKEKELTEQAKLKGEIDALTQQRIEKEANKFADRVMQRFEEEKARESTRRMTEPMRGKPAAEEDFEFSRGATPNPSTTASVRTELKKAFPDLGRVQIYDSVDALIAANPQYEGRIPSDARGFVDTAGNKAFLIAENINQGQALSVLLHEVGAHIGLKNMLGEAQYNALVNAVKSWEKKADGSVESRVAQAARARVEAAETSAGQVNDELLAYAIEEAVNAGVKPAETKGVIGRWLSQIATLFRKALEKFGTAPEKLDAQGLVDLAFGAAKIVMQPAVPQMSRRNFLRGAGAALGSMKLPPLSKNMQLDALEAAWNASMEAAYSWFDAAKLTAKTSGINKLVKDFDLDIDNESWANTLYNVSEDLYHYVHEYSYGSERATNWYIEQHGVKAVADLQQALQAQRAAVLEAVKKYGEKRGVLPEVGELFFSGTEKPSAFKRWFGDSKVVDAQGKPLVVYHGTDKDFTTFDAEKPKTSGAMHGKGFYFADAATASSYSDAPSGGGLVMPVYLKMERPFIGKLTAKDIALLRKEMPEFDAAYKEFVAEEGADGYTPSIERLGVLSGNRNEFIQKALRTAGYDGRIVTDEPSAPWTDPDTEYVVFEPTQIKSATGNRGTYDPESPNILFSRNLPTAGRVADQLVGQQKGWLQKLRENFLGIGGRTQFVDMRFPLEEALKKGGVEDLDAMQAMYYVRMYDQKMHFTSEAITEGVPEVVEKTRKDGRTERIIEAKAGANLTQAYKILTSKEVVKEAGSADAANKLVTLYMAAIRGANKGYDKLNFGRAWATQEIKRLDSQINAKDTTPEERTNLQKRRKALDDRLDTMPTPEDIKASRAEIEANPVLREAFDKVREVYNEYNRNLLQLAVQTGAISKDHARTLLAQNDYIPYYRMRGGVAEMVIGDETPIRIGNIKDNQELQELVGGDEPILDFITSSMQNTSMLVDMSLRNIAMKNAMFELRDVGLATVAKEPKGGAPKGSVTFKKDGEDYYAVVNTDVLGISSDLLVKGLAGIPTMFPMWVRAMGVPARFLRRAIVAAPPYWAKQVFRDSLGAAMSSGADIVPVLGALRQIGKDNVLERRGITGGQVFTGLPEDKKRMLDAMQAGKVSLTRGMAWLEATAAKADALTRKNQYESYLAQGLSEMEATYMALESMNFSKRGLSPSVHYANILIPFFNSQIQGLDALYKAFTGKMPMNERLEIRQKLWTRGMLMFAMSMAYAAMMQDDEAYKNAKPDEKYGNWFVPLKHFGIDETLRLPIPFELGYIFKALPEAIVNSMVREEGAKEARDAFLHIAQQTIPGGSSLGIPAAVKPALETVLGVSSYTGRPLESAQEQMLEPGYRTRENTTELARQIGEMTNFSPIKLEFLVRGYTGGMGMAALAALSAPLGGTGPEPATKRLTDMPVVGTLFQPKDAGGIIDATYERLNKVNQLVKTHEKMLQEGRVADAEKYFAEHQDDMALGSLAGSFKQFMGEVTQVERAVRSSPTMTPEKKREYLDYLRQVKIQAATSVRDSVRAASDRKTPQASPA